jgi:hypothetical protein
MENTHTPLRDVVIYKSFSVQGAAAKFQRDLKKRQKQGWRLVICTETGKSWLLNPILTAIYEK